MTAEVRIDTECWTCDFTYHNVQAAFNDYTAISQLSIRLNDVGGARPQSADLPHQEPASYLHDSLQETFRFSSPNLTLFQSIFSYSHVRKAKPIVSSPFSASPLLRSYIRESLASFTWGERNDISGGEE